MIVLHDKVLNVGHSRITKCDLLFVIISCGCIIPRRNSFVLVCSLSMLYMLSKVPTVSLQFTMVEISKVSNVCLVVLLFEVIQICVRIT